MKNRYFLMRHGHSQANQADLIISDPQVGCRLYGLTAKGREQARRSARESGLGPETVIISSDFVRALETAEVAREQLGSSEVQVMPGLRERFFGTLDGCSGERYHEVWEQDSKDPDHTPFGAESPSHLAHRLRRTMLELESRFEGATLLLVSHGDTLRFLQLTMAERPLTGHLEVKMFEPAEIRPLELPPED